jgi:CRP/FNR family cyclic AMP-dependent transcriptional regulator
MSAGIALLRQIPLFAGLADADLDLIYRLASTHTFRRGTVIFFENDPGDALHIVLSGTVKIYRLADDGREKTLAYVSEGEFFGEMALLDGEARSAVAEALETTETLAIYRSDFSRLLENHNRIALELIKVLSRRLRQTNAQLMDVVFRDARGRVVSSLIELARKHGTPAPGGVRIELKLTHQELASLVGTARETISRILGELQDEGLVQIDGRRLVIPELAQLSRLCAS